METSGNLISAAKVVFRKYRKGLGDSAPNRPPNVQSNLFIARDS